MPHRTIVGMVLRRSVLGGLILLGGSLAQATAPGGSSEPPVEPLSFIGPPVAQNVIQCTPWSVSFLEGEVQTDDPIAVALNRAGPGTTVLLSPGDYRGFDLGFRSSSPSAIRGGGGQPYLPVIIEGMGGVKIRSHGGGGTTISIAQQAPVGHVTFRNLEIVPGYSAAVAFFRENGRSHDGFVFEDCDIKGGFNHPGNRGPKSKWGIWGHSMKDFVFRGIRRPALIQDIQHEHAFYLQNPKGDLTIENVHAKRLGRTFLQLTARRSEGDPGRGRVLVRDCRVEDAGIGRGDGFKGGAAFTFAGRHNGQIVLENNVYRAGFDPAIRKLTQKGSPYGTGAFVAWDGGEKEPNNLLILRNNTFEFAEGCGDRPVVSIGGCRAVRFVGRNRFVSGGAQPALELDPVRDKFPGPDGGPKDPRLRNVPNGNLLFDRATVVEGPVEVRGRTVPFEDLLPKPPPATPPSGDEVPEEGGDAPNDTPNDKGEEESGKGV